MPSSEAVTEGIRVRARARHVPERSSPTEGHWFFAYTVQIANESERAVQLTSRHWVITDATGHVEQVRGPGTVGEQPRLEPGEGFEYTSACPLRTPFGTMHGTYQMTSDGGESFDVEIAPFALSEPFGIH